MDSQGRRMPSLAQVMALMWTITRWHSESTLLDTQSHPTQAVVSSPRVLSLHKGRKTLLPSPSPWARSPQSRKRQTLVAGRCKDSELTNLSLDNSGQACTTLEATPPGAQQCQSHGLLLSHGVSGERLQGSELELGAF